MKIELVNTLPNEILIGDRVSLDFKILDLSPDDLDKLTVELPEEEDLTKIRIFKNEKVIKEGAPHWNLEFTFYVSGDQQVPPVKFVLEAQEKDAQYSEPYKLKVNSAQDGTQEFMKIIPEMEILIPREQTYFWYFGGAIFLSILFCFLIYLVFFRRRKKRNVSLKAELKSSEHLRLARNATNSDQFARHASLALRYLWEEKFNIKYSSCTLEEVKNLQRENNQSINLDLLVKIDELKYNPLPVDSDQVQNLRTSLLKEVGL